MKKITFILLVFCSQLKANMASPYREGTKCASPFTSKNIDVLNEKIQIKLSENIDKAFFEIIYKINSDTSGEQIPLLFLALEYSQDFEIYCDEKKVEIEHVPYGIDEYDWRYDKKYTFFHNFSPFKGKDSLISVSWDSASSEQFRLSDTKYFKLNLSKGIHFIKVKYTATCFEDKSDWISQYALRYSLSPIKYWKSFGGMDIEILRNGFQDNFTTNLSHSQNMKDTTLFHFDSVPAEYIVIDFKPQMNVFAKILTSVRTVWIWMIIGLSLVVINLLLLRKYRMREPNKTPILQKIAYFVVPLIFVIIFPLIFVFIDFVIGQYASKYHGYTFLIVIFYPVLLVLYWLIIKMYDSYLCKKLEFTIVDKVLLGLIVALLICIVVNFILF